LRRLSESIPAVSFNWDAHYSRLRGAERADIPNGGYLQLFGIMF
jgi:hypothetical protein